MASDALDVTEAAGAVDALLGEGGQIGRDGLCTVEPCGRKPVAIIGGTGYVGRLLARRLLTHPTMCLGFIVGSKRSEGMVYQDVWEEKEAALMKNYGSQLWSAMPFPPQLAGIKVASLEAVLESECKIAISCVAPDVGYIEDILTNAGCKVYSISPYKRSENLTVPEVNPSQIPHAVDKSLFKSPNCVSVGTTLALKAIDDAFGLCKASVCTFQSLSGRGDAMYPAELVQGNIYPVWNTKERTEVYIGNEICALVNLPHDCLTVRAHRVGVHIGHFVDVRVNVRCPELMTTVDAVNKAFDAFAPLGELCGPEMPSLPPKPLKVIHEVGAPRPATHNQEYGGMQVAVGNVKLDDGVWDLCFSLVVNNMIRGAYGAALLMAEYHLYLQSHPGACEKLLKQYRHLDTKQTVPEATPITGPASSIAGAVQIPAPVPAARTNTLTSSAALRARARRARPTRPSTTRRSRAATCTGTTPPPTHGSRSTRAPASGAGGRPTRRRRSRSTTRRAAAGGARGRSRSTTARRPSSSGSSAASPPPRSTRWTAMCCRAPAARPPSSRWAVRRWRRRAAARRSRSTAGR